LDFQGRALFSLQSWTAEKPDFLPIKARLGSYRPTLFDRMNSRQTAEGDDAETKSKLKYLRLIFDIKKQQPEFFQRILALPRKARSSRAHSRHSTTTGWKPVVVEIIIYDTIWAKNWQLF